MGRKKRERERKELSNRRSIMEYLIGITKMEKTVERQLTPFTGMVFKNTKYTETNKTVGNPKL